MINHKLKRVAGNTAAPLYVEDVFSTYLYSGSGSTQTINNGIDLSTVRNEASFTTPGTYSWICPDDVTEVSVVCIAGGLVGGGELRYKNSITVTPGTSYAVNVGGNGAASSFAGTICVANPGTNSHGGSGGIGDGGGNGGDGLYGGGGAGGYSGTGGKGGNNSQAGESGTGGAGGGGGGGIAGSVIGAGGGGVGLYGQGASGAGGSVYVGGGAGSGGVIGGGAGSGGGAGGLYGGGANIYSPEKGASGAVRIIYGAGRAFPSTNTGPQVDAKAGGMVWTKARSSNSDNKVHDTDRGAGHQLNTNTTGAEAYSITGLSSFNSDGFSLGSNSNQNGTGTSFVSWTFRKAPKFFDVVTYTGDGVSGRQIPHNLGIAPGMIVVKQTDGTGSWVVYNISAGDTSGFPNYGYLNSPQAFAAGGSVVFSAIPDASNFYIGTSSYINGVGSTYVAYLWAHDPSEDGIVQCGSFTTDANGLGPEINLGWEPQFLICKAASATSNWSIVDMLRSGLRADGSSNGLAPNLSTSEPAASVPAKVTATGFQVLDKNGEFNKSNTTYIYLAIRRPNKPPTSGAEVFGTNTRSGTSANTKQTTVYPVDMVFQHARNNTGACDWWDRLRGGASRLRSDTTDVESVNIPNGIKLDYSDGFATSTIFSNTSSVTYADWLFKRAPGFFDVVCYTGTGVARTVPHGLGVAPELMIVKRRNGSGDWAVYNKSTGIDKYLNLNSNQIPSFDPVSGGRWGHTLPTNAVFALNTNGDVNANGYTYVAYLFASLPGISKVGSYTGNGAPQTIDCGFSTGARFVLIKRTDSTGDWYIWDSARGIVAGNDPHLSLNTTAAEVTTDDSVDPHASGFIVNQNTATNINVNGANYIFLAIA